MNCIIHCLRFASKQSWKSGLWAKHVRVEFFLFSFSLLCMFENFCNEEEKGERSLADTGFRQLEGSLGGGGLHTTCGSSHLPKEGVGLCVSVDVSSVSSARM